MNTLKFSHFPAYWQLMRMHKPIGTLLLLWPTLWSLWLAGEGKPDAGILMIFVAGTFVMRAAGCVINDYADRNFDRHVQRTRKRPLTAGEISESEALILFAVLCLLALVLVLMTNPLTMLLSLGGLALAICYPFMKRHTFLPQVVLGAAFSWGIPMAYTAQTNTLPTEIWLIYIANLIWTVVYDTFYAMVDRNDDMKIGIKSTAILFAENDRIATGILQVITVIALIIVGRRFELNGIYFLSLVIVAGLFVYQQFLIRHRSRKGCFQAFMNNNWVGFVVFAGIFAQFWFD